MSQNFNYYGLDEKENETLYIQNIKKLETMFRNKYIERLETFNKNNLEHNQEPFRFLKEENCSILILILPKEADESTAAQAYILSTPNERKEIVKVLNQDELSELDSYQFHGILYTEVILPSLGFEESQIILEFRDDYQYIETANKISFLTDKFDPDYFAQITNMTRNVIRLVSKEVTEYKKNSETKLSYFAREAYKFPFSLIDLKPLVALVDDDDFSYQLDQAMAAYHQNLFLASAATLGVVLETLCIKVLEDEQVKMKNNDTQLGKLIERLASERITSRRTNARLDVAYKVRNMASHSNPGAALREDCHFMLNVINTFAHDHLKKE